jgi:hypothetical protein
MLGLALVTALLIAGCGPLGGDDDEPTETADTISQPTTVDETPFAALPTNELTEIGPGQSTPAVTVATPDAPGAELDEATPVTSDQTPPALAGTPASPGDDVAVDSSESGAVSDVEEPGPVFTGSDGTSGATPDQGGSGNEVGATPIDGATPLAADAVDLEDLKPVEVSSCEPENIPPLGLEQTAYVTVTDVNFRVGPGAECDQVGDGPIGINIPVTVLSGPVVREDDDTFNWIQVQIVDQIGWIIADAVEPAP